ncbi:hypothetical protein [Nodosilinea sp. E11]|uniref:hypothetical protein n=1 Tax=Nodosilinea sp. E11 TaxID=3037479 RepID=UPI00293491B3|nr:hypothetical protein [Nodosilinea sp. E11]WOD40492.1 hypothetical protein RRF56_06765 [Nodosilinea sp. E11]
MLNTSKRILIVLFFLAVFGGASSSNISASAQSPSTYLPPQQQKFILTWELVTQFATALGVGISAASILASYRLYQMSKRDEYVNNLRTSILLNQERCSRLEALVNYELANEVVNCVIHSRDLELPLLDILNDFFKSDTATEEELKAYIVERFPFISTPIHSDTVSLFDDLTVMISSDLARYQVDAPGFYRVMSSLRDLYSIIETNLKNIIRNEKHWIAYLTYLFKNAKDEIQDVGRLKQRLANLFITEINNSYLLRSRKDTSDLSHIARMVSHAYLSLNETNLFKFSKTERRQDLKPISNDISDNLREAEKSLKHLLEPDNLHKYWELMARFEERNESDNS